MAIVKKKKKKVTGSKAKIGFMTEKKQIKARERSVKRGRVKDFWEPSEGKTKIRFTRYFENANDIKLEFARHYNVGVDNKALICPRRTKELNPNMEIDGKCPICVAGFAEYKKNNEATKKFKDLMPGSRFVYNALIRGAEDKGIQRVEVGYYVKEAEEAGWHNEDGKFREITHPDKGRDLIIIAKKQKGKIGFDYTSSHISEKRTEIGYPDWEDEIKDLEEIIAKKILSYEDIKEIFEMGDEAEDSDEDSDEEEKDEEDEGEEEDDDDEWEE